MPAREKLLSGFAFQVEVPALGDAGFMKVSGLGEETEVVTYREGTDGVTMRKLAGLRTFPNVTLERGVTESMELVRWLQLNRGANDQRAEVVIKLFSRASASTPKRVWILEDAWPAVYNLGDMDASSSDVLIESLEIAHEGIRYAK